MLGANAAPSRLPSACDAHIDEARATNYDALLLPGGVVNPDQLRGNSKAVQFVKDFVQAGKPIAVICDGAGEMLSR